MSQATTDPSPPNDPELLARARSGDAAALESLLERHQPQLLRFAMRMCHDPEDARDVLQESMLAAARNLEGFRGDSALSTWLFTITRSFCIKQRRRRQDQPEYTQPLDEIHGTPDAARAPDDRMADRELLAALERAIHELDPDSREVILLRDVEGLSASEAAEVLHMSVPQLKSRLHRARLRVREGLAALRDTADAPRPKPSCPNVAELFSRNLEGEISQDLCRQMQEHVDACEACRHTCDGLKQTLSMCQRVQAPRVPGAVQKALREAIRKELAGRNAEG